MSSPDSGPQQPQQPIWAQPVEPDTYVRPGRRRNMILLIGGVLLLACCAPVGMFGGLVALYFSTAKQETVTALDRGLLVSVEDLGPWLDEDFVPDAQAAGYTKTRYFDDSLELEYEYDAPQDDFAPYVQCTLTVERNLSDARTTYHSSAAGINLGLAFAGGEHVTQEPRDDIFRWGDESKFLAIRYQGFPAGFVFIARDGTRVYMLTVTNASLEEPRFFEEVVQPRLERMAEYEP